MTDPSLSQIYATLEATWPSAETMRIGALTLHRGAGGGKRVSAAVLPAGQTLDDADGTRAEATMRSWDQTPLFMVRDGNEALDANLAARRYQIIDPTRLYSAPLSTFADIRPPRVSTFDIWPPLAIQIDIWKSCGIGSARVDVMRRGPDIKTTILGRAKDRPVATAYIAVHENISMIHAIEVLPEFRRLGVARNIMGQAAAWSMRQGCTHMSLAVTKANSGARAFYAALGMTECGGYHYRIHEGT